jgi:hypothetical protein
VAEAEARVVEATVVEATVVEATVVEVTVVEVTVVEANRDLTKMMTFHSRRGDARGAEKAKRDGHG